jgi:hypothetical protein
MMTTRLPTAKIPDSQLEAGFYHCNDGLVLLSAGCLADVAAIGRLQHGRHPGQYSTQTEDLAALIRASAPAPTLRFRGNVRAIEKLTANPDKSAIVETQDVNVVAATRQRYKPSIDSGEDKELEKLLEALGRREARKLEIRPMKPFGQLNLASSKEGRATRLTAIDNHGFHVARLLPVDEGRQ